MDMAYAKTGLRAEQRVLREKMRALGMSHRQIAVEFARRYRLRSRAAWRQAYGWSQTEAAEQISTYAAQAGLGPDGTTVTMTGPHLCEYENWPGEGPEPAGRRPTPYLLSLLAAVYGCTVHDLLDVADYEHMPPADRLVVGKSPHADGQHGHGRQAGPIAETGAAPRARAAARLAPLSPAAGQLPASAEVAESPDGMTDPRHPQAAGPGGISSQRHGTAAGMPVSGALDRLSEKALIVAAARHPMINASWDEAAQEIVVKHYVNLGIAAATERGLVVPNIKDAAALTLPGLARALGDLAQVARDGKSTPADLSGGTITITNVGVFGVDAGTPILTPPEAAILAFGQIREAPWVVDGQLAVRQVTTLSLSFDHRIVDGDLGSAVLRDVGAMLADPLRMLAWG